MPNAPENFNPKEWEIRTEDVSVRDFSYGAGESPYKWLMVLHVPTGVSSRTVKVATELMRSKEGRVFLQSAVNKLVREVLLAVALLVAADKVASSLYTEVFESPWNGPKPVDPPIRPNGFLGDIEDSMKAYEESKLREAEEVFRREFESRWKRNPKTFKPEPPKNPVITAPPPKRRKFNLD